MYASMKIPPKSRLAFYGLTEDDYVEMYERQRGCCALCERTFTTLRFACIDHDHKTWLVRGLLCSDCNLTLGYLHDSYHWVRNAAEYLNVPTADQVFDTPRRLRDAPPIQEDQR